MLHFEILPLPLFSFFFAKNIHQEYTKGRREDLAKPMSAKDVYPVKIFFWVKNRIKLVASLKGRLMREGSKHFVIDKKVSKAGFGNFNRGIPSRVWHFGD